MNTCPCGVPMSPIVNGQRLTSFGRDWHTYHRDYHLVIFPNVDERTIANLDDAIAGAS